MFNRVVYVIALLLSLLFPQLVLAQSMTDEDRKKVWDAAKAVSVNGPSDLPIADQATLHLPSTMVFVPIKESTALMQMWGNSVGSGFHGLIFPKDETANWVITLNHTSEGYVKDEDAKTWNADDLMQSLKDGGEAQNEERIAMGIPALDIVGWVQSPKYDSSSHRLVWSLKAVDRGAASTDPATINYNTYALGRDGFFEVNLLTSDVTIEKDKSAAHTALAALEYKQGKRYSDYVESTDRVAEYGLAALVGGVAAKKLGLFAVIGVFIAKFAKVLLAVGVVAAGGLFQLFRRKSDDA